MKKATSFTVITLSFSLFYISPTCASTLTKPASGISSNITPQQEAREAIESFSQLSRKEQKKRVTEAKAYVKAYKQEHTKMTSADESTILLAILAILLPPLAVYLKEGDLTTNFWLSVIFTLLFWFPGVIFALLVVLDII